MLITLIFKGQRLSKSICLFLSQTFLWGKALKGHIETLSHKSIAVTIIGSLRAPFASVCCSLGLHISHSQRCHISMSQSLFLNSAQKARAQDELLFTSSPKALSLSKPEMQHEKANGPHVSLSEQHGRKTPGRAVSAHLWEIRDSIHKAKPHQGIIYSTTQQLYEVPIRQAIQKMGR